MRTKLNRKLAGAFMVVILLSAYYCAAYYFPAQKEKDFLARLYKPLSSGKTEFPLSEVTSFDWDNVDIIVQVDDSWDEGSVLDFVKGMGYGYKYLDVFYLSRPLRREYESAFIFTKEKQVIEVVRLDTREIVKGDTVYFFDSITRHTSGQKYLVKAHNVLPAAKWASFKYQGDLTFYKPKREN